MIIDLTKKQYEALLQLVYIGNHVANYNRSERIDEFDALEQAVFSRSREFGGSSLVRMEGDLDHCFPTEKLTVMAGAFIDEYNDANFWDIITNSLARRDLVEMFGEKAVDDMDYPVLVEKELPIFHRYSEEFDKNGIKNLVLRKPTGV